MLTREVREWLDKVKRGAYSYEDAMNEFAEISRFLTKEEILMIKSKLKDSYRKGTKKKIYTSKYIF